MNADEIKDSHRTRLAYVYIRQSSPHQVIHHRESQRRQRDLVQRALHLGWHRERMVVVDEDLGQSADRSQVREGFEKMVAETALGKVGLIIALEVERLCRGNRNWYHLLDVCAVTGTLLGDGEALYDPRAYNDRLLLGLKGTMSEAELHMIKQRLVEAMHSKARRGEFRYRLPPGYIWDEAGRMVKDPDGQIRSAVELVFERFGQLGSMHSVQTSMADEGLRVPALSGPGHNIRWVEPSEGYLRRILKNPLYAGAYVFGKRQVEEILDERQQPVKRVRERPTEEWHVLIKDHHEGYISWERFERNQRQLASNRRGPGPGAPREGAALLQGLVLCGRCGRRMKINYKDQRRVIYYTCMSRRRQTGYPICQIFGAVRLERAVEGLALEALQPLGIEAMIEAAAQHEKICEAERVHFSQRVERARYEVDLARRQYDTVDPANRLVAGELERRWEQALRNLESAEAEAEARIKALDKPLGEEDQRRLRSYAQDLPALWNAPTTRVQDKKRIIRCLIENVVVTVPKDDGKLKAEVHWVGGEVTMVEVNRRKSGMHRYVTDPEVVEQVGELAKEFSDDEIARILHCKGLKTSKGNTFTRQRVACLRLTYGIEKGPSLPRSGKFIYSARQAQELLGVDHSTVIRWVGAGLLRGTQATKGAPWRIQVTEEDRNRLTAADAPKGWLTLKAAATAMGVSQQTVLQRLNDNKLKGVRVQTGRRTGWRILVTKDSYAPQSSLFE